MAKNNFILYKDFDTTLDLLNDEQAGRLFKALYKYVNGRNEPKFKDGMLIVAFNMLKTQLERDLEKYNKRIEANIANGKLGGRPKNKPKEPTGLIKTQHNPTKAKKGDSVSGSVSDRDSDRDSDKKNIKKKPIPKKLYLEFVKLTDDEYKKLVDKFGEQDTKNKIQKLDDYIGSKGTKYVSHYRTILNWSKKDEPTKKKRKYSL